MAQWSRANRTLYTKLVYYGPAFGGKTTNLQALHRLTDPHNSQNLLSIKTAEDRTLFFDLLPFELDDILGYQVAMKLYTVPGQVRYETTRKVVLAGADAVVFVADSQTSRREHNVWSLQNLRVNMKAKRIDPSRVPVLIQFNKQDLADAAPPRKVAAWLGVPVDEGFPSVATESKGVLETFMAASRAMLSRLADLADPHARQRIDPQELTEQIDRAFAPHVARLAAGDTSVSEAQETPIILQGDEPLEEAVKISTELGEKLAAEGARARLLEAEAEALERTVAVRTDQLRQAYEALRGLDEMKDRFLANLSHEMRTPLTAILSAATVIRDYRTNAGERKELVGSVISSAELLQRQLDNLFRLVNLEKGNEPLEMVESSPEELAQEAIQISGQSGVQYAITDLPKRACFDLHRLARALANLIENAVKFSPPGSPVKLRLTRTTLEDQDALAVSVLDRGPGVPASERERIFAPFEQGGDRMTGKPSGIGIGLHEARSLVRRHGGTLEQHPRTGGGSEFRLTIPLQTCAEKQTLLEATHA